MPRTMSARRAALALLFALAAFSGWLLASAAALAAEPATVTLTVDYGDGVQKTFTALPWQDQQTVWDALQAAAKHPRGIKVQHRGTGERTLVTAIDGLENEGRGRNWIFDVNGKTADRSCYVFPLAAGDAVLWKFAKYR